jgi:hypothetical protein
MSGEKTNHILHHTEMIHFFTLQLISPCINSTSQPLDNSSHGLQGHSRKKYQLPFCNLKLYHLPYTESMRHREGIHGLSLCTYCYISLQQPLLYVKQHNVLVASTSNHTVTTNTKLCGQTSAGEEADVRYRRKHKGYRRY